MTAYTSTRGTTTSNTRLLALIGVLATVAVLMMFDREPDGPGKVQPIEPAHTVAPRHERVAPARVAETRRAPAIALESLADRSVLYPPRASSAPVRDLFSAVSWAPPPLSVAASAPVLPPEAPPLPFAYMGKRRDEDGWTLFLSRGDQVHVVREGDVIENTYRISEVTPPTVRLIYLPLNQSQQLSVGDPL